MTKNLSGRLLIASPYLTDGNFLRSVVFMVRHDAEGAFGLAISRPTGRRFRELVDIHDSAGPLREDDYIYRGGPVDGPLLALHDLAGVGEPCSIYDPDVDDVLAPGESFANGVKYTLHDHPSEPWGSMSIELGNPPAWITGDDDHLRILLRRPEARVRYVTSYSGWGPGQLDEELRVGGWLVGDADADLIFGDANEVWDKAVQRCGHEILTEMAPGVQFGDPNLN
ncbi:MAG: YqgE/AlgH family protein [Pirellulales bacterium]|nr:YqgE/AlgH family protein [Pirellulales bacterium]